MNMKEKFTIVIFLLSQSIIEYKLDKQFAMDLGRKILDNDHHWPPVDDIEGINPP